MGCKALKPGNLVTVLLLALFPAAAWAWYCGYDNCPGDPPGADCGGQNVPCTTGPNEPFECGFIGYHCRSVNCGATNCYTGFCPVYCWEGWADCGGVWYTCGDDSLDWGCNVNYLWLRDCDLSDPPRCSHTICKASDNDFPGCDDAGCHLLMEPGNCMREPDRCGGAALSCAYGCCNDNCYHSGSDCICDLPWCNSCYFYPCDYQNACR